MIEIKKLTKEEIEKTIRETEKNIVSDIFYSVEEYRGNDSCDNINTCYFSSKNYDNVLSVLILTNKIKDKIRKDGRIPKEIFMEELNYVGSIPSICHKKNECEKFVYSDYWTFNCEDKGNCFNYDFYSSTFFIESYLTKKEIIDFFRFFERKLNIKFRMGDKMIFPLDKLEEAIKNDSNDKYEVYSGDYSDFVGIKDEYTFEEIFVILGNFMKVFNFFDEEEFSFPTDYLFFVRNQKENKIALVTSVGVPKVSLEYINYENELTGESETSVEFEVKINYLNKFIDLDTDYIDLNQFSVN